MKQESRPLVLVVGATGRTGVHICNVLIERGYPTRIFVRNKNKITDIFKEREISFESIIQGSLENNQELEKAFEQSKHYGKVKYVISALGASLPTKVTQIEYDSQVNLINMSKRSNVEKYYFLTAYGTDNGWNFMTFLLNTLIPNVMYEKSRAQNYLRTSGLNYAIFRPPHLVGNQFDKIENKYSITQGSIETSSISRYSLANLMIDCLQSSNVPNKVTLECSKTNKQHSSNFDNLRPDQNKDMINTSHRLAKYTYLGIFTVLIGISVYALFFRTNEEL